MNTHKELAAKLLRDAAAFFTTLAKQNTALEDQMQTNAEVFRRSAAEIEKDPLARPDNRATWAELGNKLLGDAAGFFEALATQNPPLKEQMTENAHVFRKVGQLLADFPMGVLEEGSKLAEARRSPLPASGRRIDPELGLSYPCRWNMRPMRVLGESPGDRVLAAAVAARDDHTCRYCGFRSRKYQEAVGGFGAVTASQFHTACIFCAQVMSVDRCAEMRSGVLVWLPEISQAELNVWMPAIYVCRIGRQRAAEVQAILDAFLDRRNAARRLLGTDEPHVLEQRLVGARSDEAQRRTLDEIRGLRLLPLDRRIIRHEDLEFNQFPQILAFWRSKDGPFGELPPQVMDFSPLTRLAEEVRAASQPH